MITDPHFLRRPVLFLAITRLFRAPLRHCLTRRRVSNVTALHSNVTITLKLRGLVTSVQSMYCVLAQGPSGCPP